MTPDEKKRILALAEQVAGIDPTLGYWLAHHAEATRNEGRATLSPICFHLFERVGRTPPEECVCGGGTIMGSPWVRPDVTVLIQPEDTADPYGPTRWRDIEPGSFALTPRRKIRFVTSHRKNARVLRPHQDGGWCVGYEPADGFCTAVNWDPNETNIEGADDVRAYLSRDELKRFGLTAPDQSKASR